MCAKKLNAKKCNLTLLKILKKLKPEERREIITRLGDQSIDDVSAFVYNAIFTDIGMSPKKRRILRKRLNECMKDLLVIADGKIDRSTRQKKLKNQSGSGLGILLSAVVPLITSLIANNLK